MSPWENIRLHMAVGLGKLQTSDDSGPVQRGQMRLSAAEVRDNTPLLTHFGFASNPPATTDFFFAALQGDRSKAVGLGSNHTASRPRLQAVGAAQLYDLGGRRVALPNDGTIVLLASGETLRRLVTDAFVAVFNSHTHGNGPAPNQQIGAAQLTGATRAGGP